MNQLKHCYQNAKVTGSNPVRVLVGLKDPTSLRGCCWPLVQICKPQWLTLSEWECSLNNGLKLAVGRKKIITDGITEVAGTFKSKYVSISIFLFGILPHDFNCSVTQVYIKEANDILKQNVPSYVLLFVVQAAIGLFQMTLLTQTSFIKIICIHQGLN